VVNAHHESASQAHECDNWFQVFTVWPEVHDADFGLGGAVGSFDGGFEGDSFLKKVEMAVGSGDGVEVFVGGGELNSFACERVERLEEKPFALMGKAFEVAPGEPVV